MEEDILKAKAYDYAVKKKKVNQGVVEAYMHGFIAGDTYRIQRPILKLLKDIQKRFTSSEELQYAHSMGDVRRGVNAEEKFSLEMYREFEAFIKKLEAIPKNKDIKIKE